jgi:hypothetical protein
MIGPVYAVDEAVSNRQIDDEAEDGGKDNGRCERWNVGKD